MASVENSPVIPTKEGSESDAFDTISQGIEKNASP